MDPGHRRLFLERLGSPALRLVRVPLVGDVTLLLQPHHLLLHERALSLQLHSGAFLHCCTHSLQMIRKTLLCWDNAYVRELENRRLTVSKWHWFIAVGFTAKFFLFLSGLFLIVGICSFCSKLQILEMRVLLWRFIWLSRIVV